MKAIEGYIHVWLAAAHGDTSLSYIILLRGRPQRLFFFIKDYKDEDVPYCTQQWEYVRSFLSYQVVLF